MVFYISVSWTKTVSSEVEKVVKVTHEVFIFVSLNLSYPQTRIVLTKKNFFYTKQYFSLKSNQRETYFSAHLFILSFWDWI